MNSRLVLSFVAGAVLLGLVCVAPHAGKAESAVSDIPEKVGAATENAVEYVEDAALTTKVKGLFLAEKGLDSMDISVHSRDGVVTLSGAVDHQAQISLAEKIAKGANGVKAVENKLTLKQGQKQ